MKRYGNSDAALRITLLVVVIGIIAAASAIGAFATLHKPNDDAPQTTPSSYFSSYGSTLLSTTSASDPMSSAPSSVSTATIATTQSPCTSRGTLARGVWNSHLHGVDYTWGPIFRGNDSTPPPAEAFPVIRSMGFSLLRVPLSWNLLEENQSAYLENLNEIASIANSDGLYVVYDAHTSGAGMEPGLFFPSSLNVTYGIGFQFLTSWWEQNVTYNGEPGWTAVWNDFWLPVLRTVNCYNSTLGYELESEPKVEGAPESDLQQYNQMIASDLRNVTDKYIVFMGTGEGMSPTYDSQVAPIGISNIVVDGHCYISQASCSNPSTQIAALDNYSKASGVTVWIGEWAVDSACCVSENQSESIVREYVALFDEFNISSSYWSWSCSPTISDTSLLYGSDCQPFWLAYQVSTAEAS